MPRVLFISLVRTAPWQGTSQRIRRFMDTLVSLGYGIDCVLTSAVVLPDQSDVRVLNRRQKIATAKRQEERNSLFSAIRALLKLMLQGDAQRYDVIHVVGESVFIALFLQVFGKVPIVFEPYSCCESVSEYEGKAGQPGGLCKYLLNSAAAVVVSQKQELAALKQLGLGGKTCVIADVPAISANATLPARNLAQARFRSQAGYKLVGCVLSQRDLQRFVVLSNAIPLIMEQMPEVRFAVAGGSATWIAEQKMHLKELGVEDVVNFAGYMQVDDMAAMLSVADVLVALDCKGISVPLKLLDYLYSKRPVIAVDTPAYRTLLSSSNAVLVQPDSRALASAIVRLCRDYKAGQGLVKNAFETLERERLTPEALRIAVKSCYDYALNR